MKTFKEFLSESVTQEELSKSKIFIDSNTNQWPSEFGSIESYARKKGYKSSVGFFANNNAKFTDRFCFEPNAADQKWLTSIGAKLKQNEVILRMITSKHVAGDLLGIIKINLVKGIVYFFDEEKEAFETKGEKVQYARFLASFYSKQIKYV